jgi:hypothetical protein
MKTVSVIVVVGLMLSSFGWAETNKNVTPSGALVSGRVFGITGLGELKLARMANVYLLYEGSVHGAEDNTAGTVF